LIQDLGFENWIAAG